MQGNFSFKTFIKTLKVIHLAMMAGLFALIMFNLLTKDEYGSFIFDGDPMIIIIPCLFLAAYGMGLFLQKNILTKIEEQTPLRQKLTTYQTSHIVRMAPLEGIGLLGAVWYSTTNNLVFLSVSLLCFVALLTFIPNKDGIERSLPSSFDDQTYFRNQEKIID